MADAQRPMMPLLDVATAVVTVAIAAFAVWMAQHGPTGPIPVHFNAAGVPDRMGDRTELALLNGFMSFMALVTAGGMGWAARRTPDRAQRRSLRLGQAISLAVIVAATVLMDLIMLGGAEGREPLPVRWIALGISVLLIIVGSGLGRVAPNPLVGVRTPWTYRSRLSWDRSNRLAGRLFFWLGLVGLIGALHVPSMASVTKLVALVLIAAVWSVFESWRVWRADPDRQPF